MFPNVHQSTLVDEQEGFAVEILFSLWRKEVMEMDTIKKNGMYFTVDIKNIFLAVGGCFDDTKERPVVTLFQSIEHPTIFWAIPMGNASHRSEEQLERILNYTELPRKDIRSCFYHIGRTTVRSIFFISDVFPITTDYILREYTAHNKHYIIKNKNLLSELDEKLRRILSYEQSKIKTTGKFFFRQNIFGVYDTLVKTNVP